MQSMQAIRVPAITLLCLIFVSTAFAAHLHKEKEYQDSWCSRNGGVTEYVLDDRARVDCLTDTHAIEFDFAAKWAESVGQALYYSLKTGHVPGIVLIMENDGDKRFLERIKAVAEKYNIRVWTMTPAELVEQ